MNIFKAIYRRFVGEPTVASIVSPINRIVQRLNAYADEQTAAFHRNSQIALDLKEKAEQQRIAASEAQAIAANYSSLIPPKS